MLWGACHLLSPLITDRLCHTDASNEEEEEEEEEADANVVTVEWVYSFQPRTPLTLSVGQTLTFEFNDMHDVWAFTVSTRLPVTSFHSLSSW